MANLPLSQLILGGATFAEDIYNGSGCLSTERVEATLERALEQGICSIDTSPWYYPSEERLGTALKKLESKGWTRDKVVLMTKCGHLRPVDSPTEYDYSPAKVRESVNKSLQRLQTSYLDVVYLHDVQGVATTVGDSHSAGRPADLLKPEIMARNGLDSEKDGELFGEGDKTCLEAIRTLFELKDAGKVKNVGISGYPLAVMLRIAIQVRHHLSRPLDILLSFCQHTLQAFDPDHGQSNLRLFAPLLQERGGIKQIINASPLSMGLLTPKGPPGWHPSPPELRKVVGEIEKALPANLAEVALRFGLRDWQDGYRVPTIAGWSSPEEVDACIAAKKASDLPSPEMEELELSVKKAFQASGWAGWAWPAVWAP